MLISILLMASCKQCFYLKLFNFLFILSDILSYSWPFRHHCSPFSNTYSASGRLSEGESMESLTSLHSAQAHSHTSPNSHHRSSLTHNKLIMHRDAQGSRLNRSNSIRWVPIYIGVYL